MRAFDLKIQQHRLFSTLRFWCSESLSAHIIFSGGTRMTRAGPTEAMAGRLIDAGYSVTVWNRSKDRRP